MDTQHNLTIEVATRNRREHLKKLLVCLSHQTLHAQKLIILDDDTIYDEKFADDEAIASLIESLPFPTTIIDGDGSGIPSARKKCLEAIETEWAIRLDDDMTFLPSYVGLLWDLVKQFKNLGAGGGYYSRKSKGKVASKKWFQTELGRGWIKMHRFLRIKELHTSFIYNAEKFKELGGYEDFFKEVPVGCLDDSYVALKLGAAGLDNIYDLYVEFTHLAADSGGSVDVGRRDERELSNESVKVLAEQINIVLLGINPECKDLAVYEGMEVPAPVETIPREVIEEMPEEIANSDPDTEDEDE